MDFKLLTHFCIHFFFEWCLDFFHIASDFFVGQAIFWILEGQAVCHRFHSDTQFFTWENVKEFDVCQRFTPAAWMASTTSWWVTSALRSRATSRLTAGNLVISTNGAAGWRQLRWLKVELSHIRFWNIVSLSRHRVHLTEESKNLITKWDQGCTSWVKTLDLLRCCIGHFKTQASK